MHDPLIVYDMHSLPTRRLLLHVRLGGIVCPALGSAGHTQKMTGFKCKFHFKDSDLSSNETMNEC